MMTINWQMDEALPEEDLALIRQAVEEALRVEGVSTRCAMGIRLCDDEAIAALNRELRGIDRSTDVLSFPQYNDQDEIREEVYACLGDVIICPERAREQAEEYGHSYTREMVYLMVHSMLHLLGYDHMEEDEKAIMREREETVMNLIGVSR